MNIIRATGRLLCSSHSQVKSLPSVRGAIYLDKDWMPGPYPKTEAERNAAAKKYNLLPEEYTAYDPEKWEFAYGDYPHLPNRCYHDREPYYAWDYLCSRQNYGEPLHINDMIYGHNGLTLHPKWNVSFREVFIAYFFVVGGFMLFNYICFMRYERITVFKPAHRIYPGEVYYHYPSSKLSAYEEQHHH